MQLVQVPVVCGEEDAGRQSHVVLGMLQGSYVWLKKGVQCRS